MANVKACFAMRNLELELGVPPGPFSQSKLLRLRNYGDLSAALCRDVGYSMLFAARSILYVDYKPCKQC